MPRGWRNRLFGILVIGGGLLCAPGIRSQSAAGQAKTNGGFRVAGVIVSATTGEPLAQARVTLTGTKNRRDGISMITQDDGRFAFTGLSSGKYSLQGARRGYISAAYEQHEQYSTAIVTGEQFDTQNLTLRIVAMATLVGMVIDENGEGVREARLRLYAESHRDSTTRVIAASQATTDDQGTFEFAPLRPGKYYLSASAAPWYATRWPSSVAVAEGGSGANADRSLDVTYPTVFFGGSTESEGAQAITVKGGDHAQIDIHLSPVPALHVVFHLPENAEHGYQLPVFERHTFDRLENASWGGMQSWSSSSSPGVVEIGGLPPGRYRVRTRENGSGPMEQLAEVELKQDGQDLNELKGEPLGRVKLSVKMPKDDVSLKQMNLALQDEHNKIVAVRQVDANGEASFEAQAAGKYGIYAFTPEKEYSVTRMVSGDAQISGHAFILRPGESQEWSVLLAVGKTNIEGFVKRGGQAASGVMVVLVPKETETHQDMFRRDQSDLDGSFVLRDVIPGSYTVVAIEDAWGFDWSKPTLLARYAEHGQALTIGELMQGVVSLPDPVEVQPR